MVHFFPIQLCLFYPSGIWISSPFQIEERQTRLQLDQIRIGVRRDDIHLSPTKNKTTTGNDWDECLFHVITANKIPAQLTQYKVGSFNLWLRLLVFGIRCSPNPKHWNFGCKSGFHRRNTSKTRGPKIGIRNIVYNTATLILRTGHPCACFPTLWRPQKFLCIHSTNWTWFHSTNLTSSAIIRTWISGWSCVTQRSQNISKRHATRSE